MQFFTVVLLAVIYQTHFRDALQINFKEYCSQKIELILYAIMHVILPMFSLINVKFSQQNTRTESLHAAQHPIISA